MPFKIVHTSLCRLSEINPIIGHKLIYTRNQDKEITLILVPFLRK